MPYRPNLYGATFGQPMPMPQLGSMAGPSMGGMQSSNTSSGGGGLSTLMSMGNVLGAGRNLYNAYGAYAAGQAAPTSASLMHPLPEAATQYPNSWGLAEPISGMESSSLGEGGSSVFAPGETIGGAWGGEGAFSGVGSGAAGELGAAGGLEAAAGAGSAAGAGAAGAAAGTAAAGTSTTAALTATELMALFGLMAA